METKPKSKAIQYGLISFIVGAILSLIQHVFFGDKIGQGFNIVTFLMGILSFALGIYFISAAPSYMKKMQKGVISFGAAFKEAFTVTAVSSVLSGIYTFFVSKFLFPEIYQRIKETALEKAADQGGEEAVAMTEKIMNITMDLNWLIAIIFGLILGAIISLIVAAIIKKNEEVIIDHG